MTSLPTSRFLIAGTEGAKEYSGCIIIDRNQDLKNQSVIYKSHTQCLHMTNLFDSLTCLYCTCVADPQYWMKEEKEIYSICQNLADHHMFNDNENMSLKALYQDEVPFFWFAKRPNDPKLCRYEMESMFKIKPGGNHLHNCNERESFECERSCQIQLNIMKRIYKAHCEDLKKPTNVSRFTVFDRDQLLKWREDKLASQVPSTTNNEASDGPNESSISVSSSNVTTTDSNGSNQTSGSASSSNVTTNNDNGTSQTSNISTDNTSSSSRLYVFPDGPPGTSDYSARVNGNSDVSSEAGDGSNPNDGSNDIVPSNVSDLEVHGIDFSYVLHGYSSPVTVRIKHRTNQPTSQTKRQKQCISKRNKLNIKMFESSGKLKVGQKTDPQLAFVICSKSKDLHSATVHIINKLTEFDPPFELTESSTYKEIDRRYSFRLAISSRQVDIFVTYEVFLDIISRNGTEDLPYITLLMSHNRNISSEIHASMRNGNKRKRDQDESM